MNIFGKRLAAARKQAGLMQVELAVALGDRYDHTMISHVERGRSALLLDGAVNAAKVLNVSLDYLTGLTDDPRPTAEITAAVNDDELESIDKRDVRAAAGWGAHVESEPVIGRLAFRKDWLSKHGIDAKKASIIDVYGDSMEPTLQDGTIIMVDHQRVSLTSDRIFVVHTGDGVIVKRAMRMRNRWLLSSDNAGYEPLPFPKNGRVIGEVRWAGTTL